MKKKINLEKRIELEWKKILFNMMFAFLSVVIVILFYENILLASVLLGIITITGLIKWKSKLTLIIFLFGALWGPICEIIAISFGVWSYSAPNFFNVPVWLFILWGNAAAFLYQTAIEFKKLGVKK